MKLIKLKEYTTVDNVEEVIISKYPFSDFAILECEVPEIRYIKNLNFGTPQTFERQNLTYQVCTSITQFSEAEKLEIDFQIAEKKRLADDYKGRRLRIFGSSKRAISEMSGLIEEVQLRKLEYNTDDEYVINPNGKIISVNSTVYIYLDMLEYSAYTDIKNVSGVTIETFEGDPIDAKLADGSDKYFIPQV